jgi:tetratricopeptide (TPR) repeat protein
MFPPHHNAVAHAKQNVATLYVRTGRYQEARALHEDVLLTLESFYTSPNPDVALAQHNYGLLLAGLQEWTHAENQLRAAVRTGEAIFGPMSAQLARSLTSLGEMLTAQQRYTQARPVVQRAVDLLESNGRNRPLLAEAYWALGRVQHGMGNAKAAEKSLHRAQYYGWLAERK